MITKKIMIRLTEEEHELLTKMMSNSNDELLPDAVWVKKKILSNSKPEKIIQKIETPKIEIREVIKEIPMKAEFPITLNHANRLVKIAHKHGVGISELLEELEYEE